MIEHIPTSHLVSPKISPKLETRKTFLCSIGHYQQKLKHKVDIQYLLLVAELERLLETPETQRRLSWEKNHDKRVLLHHPSAFIEFKHEEFPPLVSPKPIINPKTNSDSVSGFLPIND